MYFYMDEVARAAVEMGIRVNICRGCNSVEGLDATRDLHRAHEGEGDGLVKVYVGLHSEYLTTPEVAAYALETREGAEYRHPRAHRRDPVGNGRLLGAARRHACQVL